MGIYSGSHMKGIQSFLMLQVAKVRGGDGRAIGVFYPIEKCYKTPL
jgi:hypothetical protein